ncbi:5958_t:CDS:2, partial [Gigaspora margarita]
LNLVGKDSAEEVSYFKNYKVVLKEIYIYFATSHQKWQHLKLFQSLDNEDPQLAILRVVNALYDEAFNDSCTKTRQWAKALYDDNDSEFILATKYLANILSIITIKSITLEFIGYEDDDIAPTCEYYLREYINNTLEFDELPSIFKEFALAFIKNLCQRFPDVGIYNAMRIFDFSQIPVNTREIVTFKENEIQVLGKFYGKFKQHNDMNFSAKVNRIELLKEWREAKLVLKNYKKLDFVEGWK